MYGRYKKLARENERNFYGQRPFLGVRGGCLIRPEATGYGNVYFLLEMLKTRNIELKGKTVAVSGAGNVALYRSAETERARRAGALTSVGWRRCCLRIPKGWVLGRSVEIRWS